MKKKYYLGIVSLMLLAMGVSACGGANPSEDNTSGPITDKPTDKPTIVDPTLDPSLDPTDTPSGDVTDDPSKDDGGDPIDPNSIKVPDILTIHYKNDTGEYDNLAFWLWSDTLEPSKELLPDGTDENGMYLMLTNVKEFLGEVHTKVGVIIKSKGNWDEQTLDTYIRYDKFVAQEVNGKYELEVFATLNARNTLDIVASAAEANKDKVKNAEFSKDLKSINVEGTGNILKYKLYAFDNEYYTKYDLVNQRKPEVKDLFKIAEGEFEGEGKLEFSIDTSTFDVKVNRNYTVEANFLSAPESTSSYVVSYDKVYDTPLFDAVAYTGNDLGAHVNGDSTTFKIWSPVSASMTLNLYKYGNMAVDHPFPPARPSAFDYPYENIPMEVDEYGVWQVTLPKNMHGTYYTYTANNFMGEVEAQDPYSFACGLNGDRSMVVDWNNPKVQSEEFNKLPKVWDKDPTFDIESSLDLIISEVHVRDLTMDPTWSDKESDQELKGTYPGFIKKGTSYTSSDGTTVRTGFDHLEEYGVNAVQLLPVFDAGNIEKPGSKYNWGYNPKNYNCVEGQYSSDPWHGEVRIREFRDLVAALANNKNNTRVIMDVVYNHMESAANSSFNAFVPFYFFRVKPDGKLSNGAGVGNEFKTESKMGSKFVVDSLCFWAEKYNIKGFRFDLMGLIDINTLDAARTALYKIDPDIVMYGEGWKAGDTTLPDNLQGNQGNYYSKLYPEEGKISVGGFNDRFRNALKGGNGMHELWGFAQQGAEDISSDTRDNLRDGIFGGMRGVGGNPVQTINYASCHDNFTLFDQLTYTLANGSVPVNEETVVAASVAVNSVVLMSNGMAFINGGEELFRTKVEDSIEPSEHEVDMFGVRISHNSYKSSDFTNAYKYDRKAKYLKYFNMYKSLIDIRKDLVPVFYKSDSDNPWTHADMLNVWDIYEGTTLALNRKGKDGSDYHLLFNGRSLKGSVNCGEFTTIFNNLSKDPTYTSGKYNLGQYNVIIVKK